MAGRYFGLKPIVLFYNYQTFIAGVFALVGAGLTVRYVRKQIKQSDDQEIERRRRQNLAARAMMPAALSDICHYSENCVKILRPLLPALSETLVSDKIHTVPEIPVEALFTLRQSVEFGSNEIALNIADLIRKLQIQHSRLRSTQTRLLLPGEGELVLRANIIDYIIDALEVHARASNLFHYARREGETSPQIPNSSEVQSAARACDIWDDDEIYARIKTQYS